MVFQLFFLFSFQYTATTVGVLTVLSLLCRCHSSFVMDLQGVARLSACSIVLKIVLKIWLPAVRPPYVSVGLSGNWKCFKCITRCSAKPYIKTAGLAHRLAPLRCLVSCQLANTPVPPTTTNICKSDDAEWSLCCRVQVLLRACGK